MAAYFPEGRPLEIPELPFKIPGVWASQLTSMAAHSSST
jgi:hypothetical protein